MTWIAPSRAGRPSRGRSISAPGSGSWMPGEDLHERGLARAVLADQRHDLPGVDVEVDVPERLVPGKVLLRPSIASSEAVAVISPARGRLERGTRAQVALGVHARERGVQRRVLGLDHRGVGEVGGELRVVLGVVGPLGGA